MFSSRGKPGGGGGFLPVGGGGCGTAKALETPKRYIVIIKNLFAIIFMFIKIKHFLRIISYRPSYITRNFIK